MESPGFDSRRRKAFISRFNSLQFSDLTSAKLVKTGTFIESVFVAESETSFSASKRRHLVSWQES